MKSLPRVIGPAPSEMIREAFLEKLRAERERVAKGLAEFRERRRAKKTAMQKASTPRKKKPKGLNVVKQLQEDLGLSAEEIQKLLEEATNGS